MVSDVFDALVVLHVSAALVGFGSVALSGVYGFGAGSPDRREEDLRYFGSPGRAELAVLAVPFLGVAALAVEPGGGGVVQLWDGLAAAIWLSAAALLLRVVRPCQAEIRGDLVAGRPVGVAARRLGWASVATDLAFLAALGLMVFQPR